MKIPNFFKVNKEQTTPDKFINSEISNVKHPFIMPRFDRRLAVMAYNGYWAAAIDYNSNAAASGVMRLYGKESKNGIKNRFPTTLHRSPYQRKYLQGLLSEDNISPEFQTKIMDSIEGFEIIQGHPVTDLLRNPNPIQSSKQFFQEIYSNLEVTGDAYVHVVNYPSGSGFLTGFPQQIYVLKSQYVKIIAAPKGSGKLVSGYEYTPDSSGSGLYGEGTTFSEDEIIHLKDINLKEIYYGMGKIEKGWQSYILNKYSHDYQIALYYNGAVPSYVVINKSGTSIPKKRWYKNMLNLNRGAKNSGKAMAIDQDVEIKNVAFAPKDLSDVSFNIQEIAAISGCPLGKLQGNDQVKANSESQNTSWLRNTVVPLQEIVSSAFSNFLLPRYGIADGDAFLLYDCIVPEDMEEKRKSDDTYLKNGTIANNEVRVSLGYEPMTEEADNPADRLHFNGNKLGENSNGSSNDSNPISSSSDNDSKVIKEIKSKLDDVVNDIVVLSKKEVVIKQPEIVIPAPIVNVNIDNDTEYIEESENNKGIDTEQIELNEQENNKDN